MSVPETLLNILFSLVAIFVLGAFSLLLIFLANRLLRVRADRKHTIRLENRGNCRSLYHISVSSSEPVLQFSLLARGISLQELHDDAVDDEPAAEPEPDSRSAAPPSPASAKTPATTSGPAAVNPAAALKTGQATAAKAGTLASLLGALGRLLPGSLGAGLRAQSAQAREMQVGTTRAIQAPQAAKNQVGAVQKESGKLVGAPQKGAGSSPARAAHSQPASNVVAAKPGTGARAARIRSSAPAAGYRFQTPEVEPGQAIDLTLRIGTNAKRYPVGSFAYQIESQQIALDFPEALSEPVRRGGVTHFRAVGFWRYWLPAFASILLVLLSAISLVYAYLLIWQ